MRKTILFLCCLYSILMAGQTTGPTQPEASGFQPVNSNNLVNLYTGDFSYNIPLMLVPGPDGGYPINLFYNSNVSMDQTASWVGLGWNLNCGAIQRNLRGIPDDFKGDEIKKTFWTKPSTTLSINVTPPLLTKEILGADSKKFPLSIGQTYGIHYNNYSGLGMSIGLNPSLEIAKKVDEEKGTSKGIVGSLGLNFDSQAGLTLSPRLSYNLKNSSFEDFFINGVSNTLALGARINSKQGFTDLNLNYNRQKYQHAIQLVKNNGVYSPEIASSTFHKAMIGGISFASAAPIGPIYSERTTVSTTFTTEIDPKKLGLAPSDEKINLGGSLTVSSLSKKEKAAPAYGAMYLSARTGENSILDFYRENEGALTKDKVITPIPVMTYDIFSIQGHGIGGSFRAYQNSVGKLSDATLKSNGFAGAVGLEYGTGTAQKLGADINGSFTRSYSGPWKQKKRFQKNLEKYQFEGRVKTAPLFEPFYFKMIGETQPMPLSKWKGLEQDDPLAFDVKMTWDVVSAKIRALNTLNHANRELLIDRHPDRMPRVNSIEYYTKDEISDYLVKHVVGTNQLDAITYEGENHHLEALSVLKPNGVRYNYFLPAYNESTTKETFAIPGTTTGNPKVIEQVDDKPVEYYARVNNGAGADEFYSKEEIPSYAHTFFLTSILSQDYVDIKNDGPTDDDIGSYVKFIYEKVSNYHWRFPFKGAYYTKGYASNREDDKASWQEGVKDLYYVKAIETKTHIAVFETDDSNLKGIDGNKQKQLKRIALYSKASPDYVAGFYYNGAAVPQAIQEVYLHQNDHLKAGTPNSASDFSPALDSLHFTYYDSKKGENAKYQFKYGENPAYEDHQQDRWGAYQPDRGNVKTNENPYTYQEENYADRDKEAAAWLMDEILLPSKGSISIDYEKDDYAFVQDRPAMSFVKLLGSGDGNGNYNNVINQDDEYLYFESPYTLNSDEDVKEQLEGIEYVRFRVFLDLKYSDRLRNKAEDYVEGYAKVIGDAKRLNNTKGYFKIERIKPTSTSTYKAHPIRIAAWQYIRKSRPDLGIDFGDISNISPAVFAARNVIAMVNELANLFGYYNNARIKGWAKQINNSKPSYLRLVSPKRKYGGGARVKQITLHSNDPQNPSYGQTYHYELENGQSSGVAEFEPLLGMEESPFTQPIWYNSNNDGSRIVFSNEQSFHEEPLGAGLYPGAQVGYSRVWVKNLEHDSIQFAQSGISVSEFYTAKDFPTKFDTYGAMLQEYPLKVMIPLIGMQSFNNTGYSMGYSYTLNNAIYGSAKSEATYPYNTGFPTGQAIQESRYKYKVAPNNPKALDNRVVALKKEGEKETVLMGKEVDFYIDEIEAHTWTLGAGGQINLNIQSPVVWFPSWFPSIDYTESNTRYLTTNKVIYNSPILESIEQYKDGAMVKTSNLFYDYETGDPIITSVTNEWNKPVYTYNFPAHWTYEQMKGAAQNYRAHLTISASGSQFKLDGGTIAGKIPAQLMTEGDMIRLINGNSYYVMNLDRDNNLFSLEDRNGNALTSLPPNPLSLPNGYVLESGFKNLQSTQKGKIVSLQDLSGHKPDSKVMQTVDGTGFLIGQYNIAQPTFVNVSSQNAGTLGNVDMSACGYAALEVGYSSIASSLTISFQTPQQNLECSISIFISPNILINPLFDPAKLVFESNTRNGNSITMRYDDPANTRYHNSRFTANLSGIANCFECEIPSERIPINVLHADATEFKEDWTLNYKELEDETVNATGITMTNIANGTSPGNPYAYGLKGIWRPWRTSAYLIDRKQSGVDGRESRIDIDGEYERFYWFDWIEPISYNEDYHWRWVNEVTKYNVNGHSKEGRNRLDIHAASLFGYQNHLVTASASNSRTSDIAFDSFEDYDLPANNLFVGSGHGNLNFVDNSTGRNEYPLFKEGHTGKYSFNLASGATCASCYYKYEADLTGNSAYFVPKPGKRYYISFWTKIPSTNSINRNNIKPPTKVEVRINTGVNSFEVDSSTPPIDGWYRVEGTFATPNTINNFELRMYQFEDQDVLVDDIRIQPFNSAMETYVYDAANYRLLAMLSNQNYATFYNYDEEGNLIQTKVETERGIKTISQNRQNIKE